MKVSHFIISRNTEITEYVEAMARWIQENSCYSYDEILDLFESKRNEIENLVNNSDIIYHDDPAKWGELLAIKWGLIEEPKLEFV